MCGTNYYTYFLIEFLENREIYFIAIIDVLTHYGVKKQVSFLKLNLQVCVLFLYKIVTKKTCHSTRHGGGMKKISCPVNKYAFNVSL